jgi:protein transport protein SEC61 subunit alpha
MIASCAMFSYLWIEVSGQTPRDVYNQMRVRNTRLYRVRDDAAAQIKALSRPIVTAAQLGGCAVALLTISADLLGAVGSGTGILLAVNIIHDVFDKYDQEVRAGLTSARY